MYWLDFHLNFHVHRNFQLRFIKISTSGFFMLNEFGEDSHFFQNCLRHLIEYAKLCVVFVKPLKK